MRWLALHIPDDYRLVNVDMVEEAEHVFGDDGYGSLFSVGLRSAGIVVVEDDAAVQC